MPARSKGRAARAARVLSGHNGRRAVDLHEETRMSTKTVADKLLIKPATTLWVSHADRIELIGPLPAEVQLVDGPAQATTALVFVDDAEAVRATLATCHHELAQPSHLWFAYPKANRADINRDTLWPILAEYGLRPITQVAIDAVWSALRFRPLKEGEAPFTGGRPPAP
jgi:hypothetical protein